MTENTKRLIDKQKEKSLEIKRCRECDPTFIDTLSKEELCEKLNNIFNPYSYYYDRHSQQAR